MFIASILFWAFPPFNLPTFTLLSLFFLCSFARNLDSTTSFGIILALLDHQVISLCDPNRDGWQALLWPIMGLAARSVHSQHSVIIIVAEASHQNETCQQHVFIFFYATCSSKKKRRRPILVWHRIFKGTWHRNAVEPNAGKRTKIHESVSFATEISILMEADSISFLTASFFYGNCQSMCWPSFAKSCERDHQVSNGQCANQLRNLWRSQLRNQRMSPQPSRPSHQQKSQLPNPVLFKNRCLQCQLVVMDQVCRLVMYRVKQ